MTNHTTTVIGSEGAWQGKCTCKVKSPVLTNHQEAEDWTLWHINQVNRARAHLMSRNPGLLDQRNHYLRMENDPEVSEYDRGLWRTLRVELDHRLGLDHKVVDDTMF